MAAFAQRLVVLEGLAPTIVANLRAGGEGADADAILQRIEPTVLGYLKNGPPDSGLLAEVAFYKAAAGQDDEAVRLLASAVARGALPDGEGNAVDIAEEPCFARLVKRADFQALRQRILGQIEAERRKVPLVLLAQAYPVPTRAAA
jgi:hypothetical protein